MPTWLDKILNSQFVMIGLAGLAFLIALWLVIVIARMLMGGRLRLSGGRTRQARLGIVDAFDLDRQRQLIIVRRDNTEHLIMIGGPNDLVIESEIVRVEARELRRAMDKPESYGDNRIPAPIAVADSPPPDSLPEEPLLPMPLPQTAAPLEEPAPVPELPPVSVAAPEATLVSPAPQRAPTFPLPPRRPPPQPERRPPPPPESVSRTEEPLPAPVVVPPAAEQPEPVAPPPLPPVAAPPSPFSAPAPPQSSTPVPRPPAARPAPPSFLKPLPPRPPIRPLRRATPVVPGAAPGAGTDAPPPPPPASPPTPGPAAAAPLPPAAPPSSPEVVAAPAPAPAEPPAPRSPPPPVSTAPAPPPPVAAETERKVDEQNALESLEEEMAKLLGRG